MRKALAFGALTAAVVQAVDNGLGLTPQLGFNSWYALHGYLTYPNYTWVSGFVLSEAMHEIAQFFNDKGLQDLGYKYMNVDDCIVVGRDSTGQLIADPQAFPSGVLSYAQSLNALGFRAGFYSDRGNYTCSCWAGGLKRPGSRGHELQDASTWAAWGLEEIKVDSCNDNGENNTGAIDQYALIRDGLNATGKHVLHDLCWGAGATVASVGRSLGNEWRIDEDDGSGWAAIMQNVYTDAGLASYSGCAGGAHHGQDGLGCGWNDPGLLLVGLTGLTDVQARSHMTLWSLLASKLLLSVDPRNFTAASIQTVTNPEVIAIDQDALGVQGMRWDPPASPTRIAKDKALRDAYFNPKTNPALPELHKDLPRTAKYSMVARANGAWPSGKPLSRADVVVPGTEAAEVIAVGGRPEIWYRPLANGDVALVLFNNNMSNPAALTCNSTCMTSIGLPSTPTTVVAVRDVWARTSNGTTTVGAGITVQSVPTDATVMLRLSVSHPEDSTLSRGAPGPSKIMEPLQLRYFWEFA